jgi:hypothetical protein
MNTEQEISEAEETRRGEELCRVLKLRREPGETGRYRTAWGSKTPLGIFRTVKRLVLDGE